MPTFTPPTVNRKFSDDPLIGRMNLPVGLSVLKTDGSYAQVENPSQEQISAAEAVYLGGHATSISTDEATALTTAGYGAYIT